MPGTQWSHSIGHSSRTEPQNGRRRSKVAPAQPLDEEEEGSQQVRQPFPPYLSFFFLFFSIYLIHLHSPLQWCYLQPGSKEPPVASRLPAGCCNFVRYSQFHPAVCDLIPQF